MPRTRNNTSKQRKPGFWYQHPTLFTALLGGLLMWAVFPPLGWWPLAWVAPVPWVWLIRKQRIRDATPYRWFYLAGFIYWLSVLQWIRLPHWSAYFGWFALSAYLGCYLPAFVGISRIAVHRLKVPVVCAAPVVWCGLEFARSHLLTGFSMALLGHSQTKWIQLIQVADVGGAYAVGFLVLLFAAAVVQTWCGAGASWRRWWSPPVAIAMVVGATCYGQYRIASTENGQNDRARSARVALVQGSIDTTFSKQVDPTRTFVQYFGLTRRAVQSHSDLDMIVWPESMYTSRLPYYELTPPVSVPYGSTVDASELESWIRTRQGAFEEQARLVAEHVGTAMLVGCEAVHFGPHDPKQFNSALWFDRDGKLAGRYDKMFPVMFGEYVPLGNLFPWLYRLTPMPGGLTPGTRPAVVRAGEMKLAPSICFENTVPHLIRSQVRDLIQRGEAPDALVTITNDGWFWGSSLLDFHLVCGVFRAIENRRPTLIAANTGFSAVIDRAGRIVQRGPRRDTAILVAEIKAGSTDSWYLKHGDWFAGVCLLLCLPPICAGAWAFRRRFRAAET